MQGVTVILTDAMEEILGLPAVELCANPDLNLLENNLIDSLSIVSLIQYLNDSMNWQIDIRTIPPDQFTTVTKFAAAIGQQIK